MNERKTDKVFVAFLGILAAAALIYMIIAVGGYYKVMADIPRQRSDKSDLSLAMRAYKKSLKALKKLHPVLLEDPKLFNTDKPIIDAANKVKFPYLNVSTIPASPEGPKDLGIEHVRLRVSVDRKTRVEELTFWDFLIEFQLKAGKNNYGVIKVEQIRLDRDAKDKPGAKWIVGNIVFGAYRKKVD